MYLFANDDLIPYFIPRFESLCCITAETGMVHFI